MTEIERFSYKDDIFLNELLVLEREFKQEIEDCIFTIKGRYAVEVPLLPHTLIIDNNIELLMCLNTYKEEFYIEKGKWQIRNVIKVFVQGKEEPCKITDEAIGTAYYDITLEDFNNAAHNLAKEHENKRVKLNKEIKDNVKFEIQHLLNKLSYPELYNISTISKELVDELCRKCEAFYKVKFIEWDEYKKEVSDKILYNSEEEMELEDMQSAICEYINEELKDYINNNITEATGTLKATGLNLLMNYLGLK